MFIEYEIHMLQGQFIDYQDFWLVKSNFTIMKIHSTLTTLFLEIIDACIYTY